MSPAVTIVPPPDELAKFAKRCNWLLTQSPTRNNLWVMYHHFDQSLKPKLEGLGDIGYRVTRNIGPCVYVSRVEKEESV